MKLLLFILLCTVFTIEISAQDVAKYGESIVTSTNFINGNGKIGTSPDLNKSELVLLHVPIDWDLDMWIPDTIYLASENTIKIYDDNVAYIPVDRQSKITFTWTCAVGTQDTKGITFTNIPIGNYSVKVLAYNKIDNYKEDSALTIIKVQQKMNPGKKGILAIGNSLTNAGWESMAKQLNDSLNMIFKSIGTHGTSFKHEGISGKTYKYICTDTASPFTKSGINLNFVQYLITNSLDIPDIIRLSLGINECYAGTNNDTILYYAKKIIDSVLTELPNAKILICIPSTASNTKAGWITNYGSDVNYEPYILRMRILQKSINSTYSYGTYNVNVEVAYDGFVIDRDNGYPKTGGIHTNGVHPEAPTGYNQLIRGTLNVINHIYQ